MKSYSIIEGTIVVFALWYSIPSTLAFAPTTTQLTSSSSSRGHYNSKTLTNNHIHHPLLQMSLQDTTTNNNNGDDESTAAFDKKKSNYKTFQKRKRDWIDRSLQYYTTVMREEQRRVYGQISPDDESYDNATMEKIQLATKHYFAIRLVKSGELNYAETIYRRTIHELMNEEDGKCDHAKLAVSTLLLALLLQRMGDIKATRAVFTNFFRIVVVQNYEEGMECACSAKVLQAYALFEMKQGHSKKSLKLVKKAIEFDSNLAPVLRWKQFRQVIEQIDSQVGKKMSPSPC